MHDMAGSCIRLAEVMPVLEALYIEEIVQFSIDATDCQFLKLVQIAASLHHQQPIELH